MEKNAKIVIITALSGSGKDHYIKSAVEEAEKMGKRIKVYPLGDMLFEHGKDARQYLASLTQENILDIEPDTMAVLRAKALDQIYYELESKGIRAEYDAVLILVHGVFLWKGFYDSAWDPHKILALRPDMFCTLIDDYQRVADELNQREQWVDQPLKVKDIMMWSNVEVVLVESWANFRRKPHYVIPTPSSPQFLYKLIFEPELPIVYVSMPLTHGYTPEIQAEVDCLIKDVEIRFPTIDPRSIDPITKSGVTEFDMQVSRHITRRDEFWFVGRAGIVLAYFPKIVLSWGLVTEVNKASKTGKQAWLIWQHKDIPSPFAKDATHRIFESRGELVHYIDTVYIPKLRSKNK